MADTTNREEVGKTSLGLKRNTEAALAYLLGPVTGVVFFVLEKDKFIRFHAMQSMVVFVTLFALQWMLGITIILAVLVPLVGIVAFVLWLILIYKAWQGEEFELPFAGKVVRQILAKA